MTNEHEPCATGEPKKKNLKRKYCGPVVASKQSKTLEFLIIFYVLLHTLKRKACLFSHMHVMNYCSRREQSL